MSLGFLVEGIEVQGLSFKVQSRSWGLGFRVLGF